MYVMKYGSAQVLLFTTDEIISAITARSKNDISRVQFVESVVNQSGWKIRAVASRERTSLKAESKDIGKGVIHALTDITSPLTDALNSRKIGKQYALRSRMHNNRLNFYPMCHRRDIRQKALVEFVGQIVTQRFGQTRFYDAPLRIFKKQYESVFFQNAETSI
jgi:hypothetical protein